MLVIHLSNIYSDHGDRLGSRNAYVFEVGANQTKLNVSVNGGVEKHRLLTNEGTPTPQPS